MMHYSRKSNYFVFVEHKITKAAAGKKEEDESLGSSKHVNELLALQQTVNLQVSLISFFFSLLLGKL